MSDAWVVVIVVGVLTALFKSAGPVVLGSRPLLPRAQSLVLLLAPVMLTSLVVWQTFGGGQQLELDARVAGVAAAGIAVWRGAPLVGAMVIAAAVTALLRAAA
jgi:hypothetical protein